MQWLTRLATALLLAALFLPAPRAHAQANTDSSYQTITDKFFAQLQQGKDQEAFDYIFSTNPNWGKKTEQVDQLKGQFASVRQLLGACSSSNKISETHLGDSIAYQIYIANYERQPIIFRLTYYKAGTKWALYYIKFDDNLDRLLEAADRPVQK